jgi:hypothetical protein
MNRVSLEFDIPQQGRLLYYLAPRLALGDVTVLPYSHFMFAFFPLHPYEKARRPPTIEWAP